MLELTPTLDERAAGLTADGKQKISLGRGLVRSDVNVVMFDEPLTVIDPHLKWQLRSKLKELHQRIRPTMIYVTHDQTEALTFADRVVVMNDGEVVQVGTPVELFERPHHTFVGHFIGSPGMNVLPCQVADGAAMLRRPCRSRTANAGPARRAVGSSSASGRNSSRFAATAFPSTSSRSPTPAAISVVEAQQRRRPRSASSSRKAMSIPAEAAHVRFDPAHTLVYADGGW